MKKILYISISVVIFLLIGSISYVYSLYKNVEQGVESMQLEFEDDDSPPKNFKDDESILFLLLGIGDRPGDPGRADSIILASVNPTEQSVLMFNIPRDTRTEIIGKGIQDKINHAYAFGRTEMVKNTVEHFIDRKVDYVVQINMQGMRQLVDTFGGIEVENKFEFDQSDELGKNSHHYDEGLIYLDGERALHYSRMRKRDPRGDLGRNERQRQVLQALAQKASSFSTLLKTQEIIDILGDNMKTNVSFDEMKLFYSHFSKDWKNYDIETTEIKGENETIAGIYYYQVSDEERQNITERLEEHLSINTLGK